MNEDEMMAPQQKHDINSLNRDTTNCNTNKAQMLANAMCDFNKTFKTEENFTNSRQQSVDVNEANEEESSEEMNKMFSDKEQHEQHAQNVHWKRI